MDKNQVKKKRRFANSIKDREEVLEVKQKMINVESEEFKGDIYLNKFINIKNKWIIENDRCILNNNYKWLQFYDYSCKNCLTAMYNDNNEIVEWYFDISKEIGKENDMPYEDDMYLDVVLLPNGKITLLDEDELEDALNQEKITKQEFEEAYQEANRLMEQIKDKADKLKEFTDKYLAIMLQKIEN